MCTLGILLLLFPNLLKLSTHERVGFKLFACAARIFWVSLYNHYELDCYLRNYFDGRLSAIEGALAAASTARENFHWNDNCRNNKGLNAVH